MKQKAVSLNQSSAKVNKITNIALEVITIFLLVIWIYTGISKIMEGHDFRYQLGKWDFFKSLAPFISYAVPIVELLIAGLLIANRTRKIGLWASFILMLVFTTYVFLILRFAKELPCTCGGVLSELNWSQHLVLNVTLTIFAYLGIILERKARRSRNEILSGKH